MGVVAPDWSLDVPSPLTLSAYRRASCSHCYDILHASRTIILFGSFRILFILGGDVPMHWLMMGSIDKQRHLYKTIL